MTMRYRHRWHFLCFTILLLFLWSRIALAITSDLNLPLVIDETSAVISPKQEYAIGQAYLKYLRGAVAISYDPEINSYLTHLLVRLASVSGLPSYGLSSLVKIDHAVNAFAAPGGIVAVYTGLFAVMKTEAQFASVMSHELGHLKQRHYARGLAKSKENTLPLLATLLGAVIIGATTGNANALIAGGFGATAHSLSQQLAYSRDREREADSIGIEILAKAGFNPNAMAEAFESMSKGNRYSAKSFPFLSTHPLDDNRIADAQSRAKRYPDKGIEDSLFYELTKMRVYVLFSDNKINLQKILMYRLKQDNTNHSNVIKYGLVLVSMALKQYKTAQKYLTMLLQKKPDNITFILADVRLKAANNHIKSALKIINANLEVNTDYYPLLVTKAEILLQDKQYKAAMKIWLALSKKYPNNPYIWHNLADIQIKLKNLLQVHIAMAHYFILRGDMPHAITRLSYINKIIDKHNEALQAKVQNMQEEIAHYKKMMHQLSGS